MNAPDMKPGDEVRIFTGNKYHPAPGGGWVGTVAKVGRKYATATYEVTGLRYGTWGGEETTTRTIEFDIATGLERDSRGSRGLTVKTPAQIARDERHGKAMVILWDAGLEMRTGHRLTLELAEALAATIEAFERD